MQIQIPKKWEQDQQATIERSPRRKPQFNEKELSPWNNDQYKSTFQPHQYYQNITNQQKIKPKKYKAYSKSVSLQKKQIDPLQNRLSDDFLQLVKLQKKGAYLPKEDKRNGEQKIKMNLVNVNLADDLIPIQKYSYTIDGFYNNERSNFLQSMNKQQPMRVRIFKKNIQKNKHVQGQQLLNQNVIVSEINHIQNHLPELKMQNTTLYPAMPKRSLRLNQQYRKPQSFTQTKNQFFPKLALQKRYKFDQRNQEQKQQIIFCRGEIIGNNSKRKLKYRQFQLKNSKKPNNESILFLQQFSSMES